MEGLLQKAKSGDLVARDELVYRFQRLVVTLVSVCVTGKPNYRSSFQLTFMRMFASKGVPVKAIAAMLKGELERYDKEELFLVGQLAVMNAIERCEKNLASTIVICFKEQIHSLIKDTLNRAICSELMEINQIPFNTDEILFDVFMETLTEEEWILTKKIIEGDTNVVLPEELKMKLSQYLKPE